MCNFHDLRTIPQKSSLRNVDGGNICIPWLPFLLFFLCVSHSYFIRHVIVLSLKNYI